VPVASKKGKKRGDKRSKYMPMKEPCSCLLNKGKKICPQQYTSKNMPKAIYSSGT